MKRDKLGEGIEPEPPVPQNLYRKEVCEVIHMLVEDVRYSFFDNKRQVRAIKALADLLD